jgi:DNA processing protein
VRTSGAAPLSVFAAPAVALVGTRKPSPLATRVAYDFGAESALCGFVVVSGLALGCDSAAHRGCLSAAGITVAVLPCGVDRVAPVSNRALGEAILKSGGCFVSQYPPGTPPKNFRFVERNRVVAALSRAVVVFECEERSGTLHTARFAREQNKPLACFVPKNGKPSSGCRLLLEKYNATPLRNKNDLRLFLDCLVPNDGGDCSSPRKRGGAKG